MPVSSPLPFFDSQRCANISVIEYLQMVYPTAAQRLAQITDSDANKFFNSLHFYYDFGCVGLCKEPGILQRWLYDDLLPCTPTQVDRHARASLRPCMLAHHRFEPEWALQLLHEGWAEVEHRSGGFGGSRVLSLHRGEPRNASDFLDAGVASMWYTFRRGSGIFYRMGKTLMAPGKTAAAALLLQQLTSRKDLAAAWQQMANRNGYFIPSSPSKGAGADAERLSQVAQGKATCADAGVQPCRCRYVLHDAWDDAIVWMARALGFETVFLSATLLCNQPTAGDETTTGRGFGTAYPELVDVRPLGPVMVAAQSRGVHNYLMSSETSSAVELRARRKRPENADLWVRRMKLDGRLTLRDPPSLSRRSIGHAPDVNAAAGVLSCDFSVMRSTLQCEGHISSRWPLSTWHQCGLPTCGFRGATQINVSETRQGPLPTLPLVAGR